MCRKTAKSDDKLSDQIRLYYYYIYYNERGLPKWEVTRYRDGEEGVVGGGGASGAG